VTKKFYKLICILKNKIQISNLFSSYIKNLNKLILDKIKQMNRPGTSISKAKVTKISTDDFQHNKVQQ